MRRRCGKIWALGTRDFLKRINTSVSLTYSFHKDSRVQLLDAMLYKPRASNP